MNLENFQSVVTKYNIDSTGNPFAIKKSEEQQINPINLSINVGVIDEIQGFTIRNRSMAEVSCRDGIELATHYFVDYPGGRVYFHNSLASQYIQYTYYDLGIDLLSATRTFTKVDSKGNIVELLADLVQEVDERLEELSKISVTKYDNYTKNILAGEWVNNTGEAPFKYVINHNLNSNNLATTMYDSTGNTMLVLMRPIDLNNVEAYSFERENIKIVLTPSHF